MGQCSSNNKHQQNKAETLVRPSEDAEARVLPPRRAVESRQRRAIDEPSTAEGRTEDASKTKKYDDFDLAALRPSVDTDTCAALLALKTGRGSSVGGYYNQPSRAPSGEARGSPGSAMAVVPEDASVTMPRHADSNSILVESLGPEDELARQKGTGTAKSRDSNERLERLLLGVHHGWADNTPPPKLPAS